MLDHFEGFLIYSLQAILLYISFFLHAKNELAIRDINHPGQEVTYIPLDY